jgi:hypothetical protein
VKVFIVDNGPSMFKYRHIVTVVLEALALKLEGLDKDGLDVHFTFSGDKLDFKNQKRHVDSRCRKSMMQAWRTGPGVDDSNWLHKTDMANILGWFFDEYNKASVHSKDKTLIVLTDGNWEEGGDSGEEEAPDSVARKIVDFCRNRSKKEGYHGRGRTFTIEFVRFGDDPKVIEKFVKLDDDLPTKYGIE